MTRSWDLTLPLGGTWYNLWALIVAAETAANPQFDQTFSNSPFISSMVSEQQIQSDLTTNGGMTITISDKKHLGGTNIVAGQADLQRTGKNTISLKDTELKSDTNGALIHVRTETV